MISYNFFFPRLREKCFWMCSSLANPCSSKGLITYNWILILIYHIKMVNWERQNSSNQLKFIQNLIDWPEIASMSKDLSNTLSFHEISNAALWYTSHPQPTENLLISPDIEKSPHQIFIPPLQQFSSYNPIKTASLAVVIASAPFFQFHTLWAHRSC